MLYLGIVVGCLGYSTLPIIYNYTSMGKGDQYCSGASLVAAGLPMGTP